MSLSKKVDAMPREPDYTPNEDSLVDVTEIADEQGIDYRVMISSALEKRLKPNAFLAELGIDFSERMENILNVLKGNLVPHYAGTEAVDTIPPEGISIPFSITQGPLIWEELISIKVALHKGHEREAVIVLTTVPAGDTITKA
jgi:hypothetical protein